MSRKLIDLVEKLLNEDFDAEMACRFLKVSLVCTQDMPKSRPNMTTAVSMLMGEVDLDDKISRPGLSSELKGIEGEGAKKRLWYNIWLRKAGKFIAAISTTTSVATMTFISIYYRSG